MASLSFFALAAYASGYGFLLFMAFCFASGVYYLAELAEEHTALTRRVLCGAVYALLGLHAALLLWDRLPFWPVAAGVAAHVAYYAVLSQRAFPCVRVSSAAFCAAAAAFVLANVLWGLFFLESYEPWAYGRHSGGAHAAYLQSGAAILSFMLLCVWAVPFGMLLSLSQGSMSTLPGGPTAATPPPAAPTVSRVGAVHRDRLPGAVDAAAGSEQIRRRYGGHANLLLALVDRVLDAARRCFRSGASSAAAAVRRPFDSGGDVGIANRAAAKDGKRVRRYVPRRGGSDSLLYN